MENRRVERSEFVQDQKSILRPDLLIPEDFKPITQIIMAAKYIIVLALGCSVLKSTHTGLILLLRETLFLSEEMCLQVTFSPENLGPTIQPPGSLVLCQ